MIETKFKEELVDITLLIENAVKKIGIVQGNGVIFCPNTTAGLTITENAGNVVLDWAAVTGASSYRIEASDDPYTGYSTVTTTANLTWSGAASTAKKFYRVIALP